MDAKIKGEIAYKLVKYRLSEESLPFRFNTSDFRREMGNAAKALGIPVEAITEFTRELVNELVHDVFSEVEKK